MVNIIQIMLQVQVLMEDQVKQFQSQDGRYGILCSGGQLGAGDDVAVGNYVNGSATSYGAGGAGGQYGGLPSF